MSTSRPPSPSTGDIQSPPKTTTRRPAAASPASAVFREVEATELAGVTAGVTAGAASSTPPAPPDIAASLATILSKLADMEARDAAMQAAIDKLNQDRATDVSSLDATITTKVDAAVQIAVTSNTVTEEAINNKISAGVTAAVGTAVDAAVAAKFVAPVEDTARAIISALNLEDRVDSELKQLSGDKLLEGIVKACAADPAAQETYTNLQRAFFRASVASSKAEVTAEMQDFTKASISDAKAELEAMIKQVQADAYRCNQNVDKTIERMLERRGLPAATREEVDNIPSLVANLTDSQRIWHAGGDMETRTTIDDLGNKQQEREVLGATAYFGTATLHTSLMRTLRCDTALLVRIRQGHSHIEQANYSSSSDRRHKRLPIRSNDVIKDDLLPHLKPPITPALFLDWYDVLVRKLTQYNMCLLPFDAINVGEYGHHTFVLPGIGYQRFLDMDEHLYSVMEHLLPDTGSFAGLFARNDGSGTKVLYHLLCQERETKFLDKDHLLIQPSWDDCRGDIYLWAKLVTGYHRFLRVRQDPTSAAAVSKTFLSGLNGSALYGYAAATNISSIDALLGRDLPPHLQIMHLAKTLADMDLPRSVPHLGYPAETRVQK